MVFSFNLEMFWFICLILEVLSGFVISVLLLDENSGHSFPALYFVSKNVFVEMSLLLGYFSVDLRVGDYY
jgi:hypothetical protein